MGTGDWTKNCKAAYLKSSNWKRLLLKVQILSMKWLMGKNVKGIQGIRYKKISLIQYGFSPKIFLMKMNSF